MRLRGKVAIITGGGGSIGSEISRQFAAEGATVAVADMMESKAAQVCEQLGRGAVPVRVDVADPDLVQSMISTTVDRFGRLDILVNNAGIGLTRLFLDTTLEEWERVFRVNLTGTFLCSQHAARVMARQGSGKIINVASLSGQRAGTGRAAYGASKAGVTLLTRQLAVELASLGITVNEVVPGPTDTDMTRITHDESTRQAYYDRIPMKRYATPAEVAAAVVFLASSEADFINGHSLNVDGGYQAAGIMFDLKPAE